MESYFTVLSASIRPEIDEKITLALLLTTGSRVRFSYSKEKLGIAKQLLPASAHKYLKDVLKSISVEAYEQNAKDVSLFGDSEMAMLNPAFDFSYISYLTKYSNAVLNFSDPKRIDREMSDTFFTTLFKKYVSDAVAKVSDKSAETFDELVTKIYDHVRDRFNIEEEFTSKEIPNLAVPLKIDLIGRNDQVVYAQTIDMERPIQFIRHDLCNVAMLNEVFGKMSKSFIVTAEPDKESFPVQHQTWTNIRSNFLAEYVDVSEAEKLKQYAAEHNVKPLVSEKA